MSEPDKNNEQNAASIRLEYKGQIIAVPMRLSGYDGRKGNRRALEQELVGQTFSIYIKEVAERPGLCGITGSFYPVSQSDTSYSRDQEMSRENVSKALNTGFQHYARRNREDGYKRNKHSKKRKLRY